MNDVDTRGSDLLTRAKHVMEFRDNGFAGANGVAGRHEAFGWM